jgi:serine/threonine protein kinase
MAAASPLTDLLVRADGQRRLGPFVLVEQLGRGGFAPVWLAKEVYGTTELRTAAVKLFALKPSHGDADGVDASQRQRIVEEARALCRVEHPNVVRFYALPIAEAGTVMGLAMEHVAGTPLDATIGARGTLSPREVLAVGLAVASALAAVHRAGLVHRDVKPANVIEAGGVYKLIDFGIAAADVLRAPTADGGRSGIRDAGVEANEDAGATVASQSGTPGYIDPECVHRGIAATAASDLYALGATLFECLTGRVPAGAWGARGLPLREDVLSGQRAPRPVLEMEPTLPPALAKLVDALIAPRRAARPGSAEAVALRLAQIADEIAGQSRPLPPEEVGPFRGLRRFEAADRDVYFGRTTEVAAAMEMLRGRGLLAVIGASGSGKSSLVRAGVLPAVAAGRLGGWPPTWDAAVAEPGAEPDQALVAMLEPYLGDAASLSPDEVVLALARRAEDQDRGLLLVVDQLEELATLADPDHASWAVDLLARIAEQPLPGLRAVVTVRRDLLDPLLALPGLGKALVRGSLLVEPIGEVAWGDVVDQALSAYGYRFEDAKLREELLEQLEHTAGAMPLSQFALTEIWRNRDRAAKQITRAAVDGLGGVAGALERHADATVATLGAEAATAARRVLLELTTAQGTRITRRLPDLEAAAGVVAQDVVVAFERARLVVRSPEGISLAHEALLSQWGQLRSWVAEAREDRLLAEELEHDGERWRIDPHSVPLWPRRRVAFAADVERRGTASFSERARAFLRASRASERIRRTVLTALAVLAFAGMTIAGAVWVRALQQQRESADALRRVEQARRTELEENQREIDRLVHELAAASTPDEVAELQRNISKLMPPGRAPAAAAATRPTSTGITPPPPTVAAAQTGSKSAEVPPVTKASAAMQPPVGRSKEWDDGDAGAK